MRRDFDPFTEVLAGEEEVEGWWGYDDFGFGVAGGIVEVGDDFFYCGYRAVPARADLLVDRVGEEVGSSCKRTGYEHFEVTADEELATHLCGICLGVAGECYFKVKAFSSVVRSPLGRANALVERCVVQKQ